MNKGLSLKNIFRIESIRSYAMVAILVGIWILFSLLTDGMFSSVRNISNLSRQMAITGILATGMIVVLLTGSFDLSVGSIVALTGTVASLAYNKYNINPFIAMIIALLVGLLCGYIQGWWIAKRGVPAFVVTLGGQMIFRGITLILCEGRSVPIQDDRFLIIGQAYLPRLAGYIIAAIFIVLVIYTAIGKRRSRMSYNLSISHLYIDVLKTAAIVGLTLVFILIMNGYEGIPVEVSILMACVALFTFFLKKTKFGRYIYATGGNKNAAIISGINVKSIYLKAFTINGLMAGLAGLILTARLASATPMAGNGMELDAIASCVIGGVSLSGGMGKVKGAIVGALVMASLNNGMSLLNVTSAYQYVIKGIIFVLAVWFDVISKDRRN